MRPKRTEPIQWSPEIAYTVGLITTDGCLSGDGRHITLISKDIQLLNTFRQILGINAQIRAYKSSYTGRKDCYRLQFGDVILFKWLCSIGLSPNKTKTIGMLKIPDKYFFDFLRGHFDGDGSNYSYWDTRWKNSFMFYTTFLSASSLHISWLQKKIYDLAHVKGRIGTGTRVWQLRFAKKESRVIIQNMYHKENLPCLERKRVKIRSFLEIEKNRILATPR